MVRYLREVLISGCSDISIEYFRNALLELKLIGALQKVVAHKSYLLLPVAVSILCVLNSYGAQAAFLQLVYFLKPFR